MNVRTGLGVEVVEIAEAEGIGSQNSEEWVRLSGDREGRRK